MDSIALEDCHYISTIMTVDQCNFLLTASKTNMLVQLKSICLVALLVPFLVCYEVAVLIGIITPTRFFLYLVLSPFERPRSAFVGLDSQFKH